MVGITRIVFSSAKVDCRQAKFILYIHRLRNRGEGVGFVNPMRSWGVQNDLLADGKPPSCPIRFLMYKMLHFFFGGNHSLYLQNKHVLSNFYSYSFLNTNSPEPITHIIQGHM